jgi:DNA recombination protein RmuC
MNQVLLSSGALVSVIIILAILVILQTVLVIVLLAKNSHNSGSLSGALQSISVDVSSLKNVMANVKTKGVFGEVQLQSLLDDILVSGKYEKNVKTNHNSDAMVEFAIKIPCKNDGIQNIWLPIDAKFPTKDYERLTIAYEKGDPNLVLACRKELVKKIRSFAKDIVTKYIDPPYTTDFAVLFVPFESLYTEILSIPGLFQRIQSEYKVTICGPGTIAAFLNSLQLGFHTLAVEKRTSDVWKLMGEIETGFSNFSNSLEITQRKLESASSEIDKASKLAAIIERKLHKLGEI